MAVLAAVTAAFGAASEVAKAVDEIGRLVDGDRTVVLVVANGTDHRLELVYEHHEHGGWGVTPAHVVGARTEMVCGSKDRGFMTGTKGLMRFKLHDGRSEETFFELNWSNPFVGANKGGAAAYVEGDKLPFINARLRLPSTRYKAAASIGAGDKDAEMRYTLLPKAPKKK